MFCFDAFELDPLELLAFPFNCSEVSVLLLLPDFLDDEDVELLRVPLDVVVVAETLLLALLPPLGVMLSELILLEKNTITYFYLPVPSSFI